MSDTTSSTYRAAIVTATPVVLLAAFLSHPYIPGRLPNDAAIAAAVAAGPTRWGLAHVAAGVASAVVILAFVAIRSYLREAGEARWSAFGLPFVVIGSVLYTLLPGMEFAPLTAVEVGADPQAAQAALLPWFLPTLIAGAVTFAIGVIGFATAVARSGVLGARLTWLVIAALLLMAASRFVPLAAVQFYVQSTAALIALWPLAYHMRRQPQARPAAQTRPVPAA